MDAVELGPAICAGCGMRIAGGTVGCHALYEELVGRDFTDVRFFLVHRLMVDTYCLQHPDRYCVSAKSLAAHLCGLCDILERGASRAVGSQALRGWLDGARQLDKPELPAERGELTIADVRDAETSEEHALRVDAWARSTWEAYEPLHSVARGWLDAATATGVERERSGSR